MADPAQLPTEELQRAQHLGAATYLGAYLHLVTRALGVDTTPDAINAMVLTMIEPMNHATKAMWYAMMNDPKLDEALFEFRECLSVLHP